MNPSRESVMTALFNALSTLVPNGVTVNFQTTTVSALTSDQPLKGVARRIRTFDQAGPKPCCYIGEFGNVYSWQSESLGSIKLEPCLFLYFDEASDDNVVPVVTVNNVMDRLDYIFRPDDRNGKCTLGGLVSSLRISGEVPMAPGDLGGSGVTAVPLEILIANGDLS